MGRPAGNSVNNNNNKKEIIKPVEKEVIKAQEIDIEALIKKVTDEVSGKYEDTIKDLKNKIEEKEEVKTEVATPNKKKHKFIPDNTKIRLKSNVEGKFIYMEDRGKTRVFLEIDDYGLSTDISYEELRIIKPLIFKTGKLAVEDVLSGEDIELEDLLKDVRFDSFYLDENKVSPIDIENILSNETNISIFEKKVSNTPDMLETLLEVAYVLYRRGQFNDNAKMNYLRQTFNNPNLFK